MYKRVLRPWKRPWYTIGRYVLGPRATDEQVSRYCKMLKLKVWVTWLEELLHIQLTNMDLDRQPPLHMSKAVRVFRCFWVVVVRYYRLSISAYRQRQVPQTVTSRVFIMYMHKLLLSTLQRTHAYDVAGIDSRRINPTPRPGWFHYQRSRPRVDAALADLPQWLREKGLNPKVCWTCGKGSSHKYQKCGRCTLARYCSSECQEADWKDMHCGQCKELSKLGANHALKLVKDVMGSDASFTQQGASAS